MSSRRRRSAYERDGRMWFLSGMVVSAAIALLLSYAAAMLFMDESSDQPRPRKKAEKIESSTIDYGEYTEGYSYVDPSVNWTECTGECID